MGPLRGGLIAALLPGAAWAEVCEKVRPAWDGTEVTMTGEAITQFSTVPALLLLLASAIAIRFRSQWGVATAVVLWTVWVSVVAFFDATGGMRDAAMTEGCIGAPVLFIIAVAAICTGMIVYTFPPPKRGN